MTLPEQMLDGKSLMPWKRIQAGQEPAGATMDGQATTVKAHHVSF